MSIGDQTIPDGLDTQYLNVDMLRFSTADTIIRRIICAPLIVPFV